MGLANGEAWEKEHGGRAAQSDVTKAKWIQQQLDTIAEHQNYLRQLIKECYPKGSYVRFYVRPHHKSGTVVGHHITTGNPIVNLPRGESATMTVTPQMILAALEH